MTITNNYKGFKSLIDMILFLYFIKINIELYVIGSKCIN